MIFVSSYSSLALLLLCLVSATDARAQIFSEKKNNYYLIEKLNENRDDKSYGFTKDNPVKVGRHQTYGGAYNEQCYLHLLRDEHGDTIISKRVGTCCTYKSENGFLGSAALNEYEIYYRDKQGNEQSRLVFISHFDYEQPKVLYGFGCVKKEVALTKE
jgi:hypothetical protein